MLLYCDDGIHSQSLDFYLPQYNIAIECQGEQHFRPVDFANKGKEWAVKNFKHVQELDERKRNLYKEHNIKLLYYSKEDFNSFLQEKLIKDKNKLLEIINGTEKHS